MTHTADQATTTKTNAEIFCDRFLALPTSTVLALRCVAKGYQSGTRFSSPEDLIQEAVVRTIAGTRVYPLTVDVGCYVRGVMRSIAYSERNLKERQSLIFGTVEELEECHALSLDLRGGDAAADLDARRFDDALRAALAESQTHFKGDPVALLVIDSLLAGLVPREACRQFNMEMNAYRAARQRAIHDLRRRLGALTG